MLSPMRSRSACSSPWSDPADCLRLQPRCLPFDNWIPQRSKLVNVNFHDIASLQRKWRIRHQSGPRGQNDPVRKLVLAEQVCDQVFQFAGKLAHARLALPVQRVVALDAHADAQGIWIGDFPYGDDAWAERTTAFVHFGLR